PYGDARVFRVADCKKTLRTVCRQLGLPHFSPRSLLQAQVLIPSSRQISQFAILCSKQLSNPSLSRLAIPHRGARKLSRRFEPEVCAGTNTDQSEKALTN